MQGDLAKIQGKWRFLSLELDGVTVPSEHLDKSNIRVAGDTFTTFSSEAEYKGTVTIDASTTPKQLDVHFKEGPHTGLTSQGIYEFEGSNWRLCIGLVGAPRPEEFVTSPGSGHALELLERVDETAADQDA